jgi:DDE superfamily endonuclease
MCPHHAQKNVRNPWQQQPWVMPPQANADVGCAMADGLEVYPRPDAPQRPQVCLDETSTHLVADTREPIPAAPGQPERLDDASERQGTAHLCMGFEPWAGHRRVKGTERRTAVDFAHLLRELSDAPYPQADTMVLVMDHRNTHKPASLYEACAPAEARRLMERVEIHDTPKPGSWLTMAETELSVLTTPCLNRRMPALTTLRQAVAAWERRRHQAKGPVDGRFTTPEARIKLKRLYPSIQLC